MQNLLYCSCTSAVSHCRCTTYCQCRKRHYCLWGVPVVLGENPTASGGVPPYQYEWSNSDTFPNTTVGIVTNATMYLTVTDNLCVTAIDSVTITVKPNMVIDSIVTTDVSCYGGFDGTVCVFVSGGMPPYHYVWENGLTGQCTNGLGSFTFTFWVSDNYGCFLEDSIKINQPSELAAQLISSTGGIAPDTLTVSVLGGTPPYSYQWADNSTSESVINYYTSSFYQVTIIDNKGCETISNIIDVQDTCINSCLAR